MSPLSFNKTSVTYKGDKHGQGRHYRPLMGSTKFYNSGRITDAKAGRSLAQHKKGRGSQVTCENRAKTRILLVEDEIIVAMGIENWLVDSGYTVIATVLSGEEAVEAAIKL